LGVGLRCIECGQRIEAGAEDRDAVAGMAALPIVRKTHRVAEVVEVDHHPVVEPAARADHNDD